MWTLHKLQSPARRSTPSGPESPVGVRGPASEPKITDQLGQQAAFAGVFSEDDLMRFPALRKKNFWCIQRHQARGQPSPVSALSHLTSSSTALRPTPAGGRADILLGCSERPPRCVPPRGTIRGTEALLISSPGISKDGEASRLAVQTTLHDLDYTVHEGRSSLCRWSGRGA